MRKVVPIVTSLAFNHISFGLITLLAVTELVKEILVVQILSVFIILLVWLKLASLEHPTVPTITPKVKALTQLEEVMVFVALEYAPNAYPMFLEAMIGVADYFFEISHISAGALQVASLASVHILHNVAFIVAALFQKL